MPYTTKNPYLELDDGVYGEYFNRTSLLANMFEFIGQINIPSDFENSLFDRNEVPQKGGFMKFTLQNLTGTNNGDTIILNSGESFNLKSKVLLQTFIWNNILVTGSNLDLTINLLRTDNSLIRSISNGEDLNNYNITEEVINIEIIANSDCIINDIKFLIKVPKTNKSSLITIPINTIPNLQHTIDNLQSQVNNKSDSSNLNDYVTLNTDQNINSNKTISLGKQLKGQIGYPTDPRSVNLFKTDINKNYIELGDVDADLSIKSKSSIINFNNNRLNSVGDPIDSSDVATKNYVTIIKNQIIDTIYPVGSVYINIGSMNPNTQIGGTWERIDGGGITLVNQGTYSEDNTYFSPGSRGGKRTVTLTLAQIPSHNHNVNIPSSGATTTSSNGAHTHRAYSQEVYQAGTNRKGYWSSGDNAVGSTQSAGSHTHSNPNHSHVVNESSRGSGSAHENMPPYLVVYMWKRIT